MGAMARPLPHPDDGPLEPPDVPLEEIIFSCEICQATVSELYATKKQNEGLFSGGSSDGGNGIVTKMWIGACAHVFCGKHLEGGGVAFHPKGVTPSAGCPVCPGDVASKEKQDLYAIHGLNPGEYDDIIPASWLCCPPTRLDADDVEMDALRFQYQHLARYSLKVNKAWKAAENKLRVMESTLSGERKQFRKRETETKDALRQRDAIIEDRDAKLEKWNRRKDVISHYMHIVGPMAKDIADMRKLLVSLGHQVPERDYSYQPIPNTKSAVTEERVQETSSATLVGSNARKSSASRKRKATNDAYADSQEQDLEVQEAQPSNGRPMMMPPPLPKLRPPRKVDLPETQPSQLKISRRDDLQSHQQRVDHRDEQLDASQQQPGRFSRLPLSQPREQSSQRVPQAPSQVYQRPTYITERLPPASQPSVQLFGTGGWQDQPRPKAAPGLRERPAMPSGTQQFQPGRAQKGLPYRGLSPSGISRSNQASQYRPQPSREPLPPPISRTQERFPAPRSSRYEASDWRESTARDPPGASHGHEASQRQSPYAQHTGTTRLDVPAYRQSRRGNGGHNGTTTLSSEFRAESRSTAAQRKPRLLSQPPERKVLQRLPFSTAGHNAYLEDQSHVPSEAPYYDPVYGTMAQQSGENAPRQMEGFNMPPPPARSAAQAPLHGNGQYRLTTPAQRKHLEPPAASSVVSPFFGQPSRQQPEAALREHRQQFSYAPLPSSTRGSVMNRYQRTDGMAPPSSAYTRMDRGMPSRDTPYAPSGGTFLHSSTAPSSTSAYARGLQPAPFVSRNKPPPPPAVPRERVSLPSIPRSTRRDDGGDTVMEDRSAYDPRSIFSGAGPTRRSIRR